MSKGSEAKLPSTGQKQANRTRKQVSPGWGRGAEVRQGLSMPRNKAHAGGPV